MIKTCILSCTAVLVGLALAATAVAEDKKPVTQAAPATKAATAAPAALAAAAVAPAKIAAPGVAPPAPAKIAAPAAAPTAAPAAPAGPPMPAPSKELGIFMKGFEGSWRCDTKFAAGAMGPGSPEMTAKSTVRIKKEFGGFSWHGDYSLPKSKMMPAMSGIFQVGYDPGSNQATIVGYDSMGTAMAGVGPISGESVAFVEDGYMMGMKVKVRETMTKRSPKEIFHAYEVDMGKGFQPMGDDTCKGGHAAAAPAASAEGGAPPKAGTPMGAAASPK